MSAMIRLVRYRPAAERDGRDGSGGAAAPDEVTDPDDRWDPGRGRGRGRGREPGWRPRRRGRIRRWLTVSAVAALAVLVFRRALTSVVLTALSAALHLVGISAHLPRVSFAWPWQTVSAGTTSDASLGPWVLQKIEGISRPALGQANFDFVFTRTVSKNIGPLPCWYSSTFYAVGHASATVDLNPGPAWWAPSAG